jgi:hypothetical protein
MQDLTKQPQQENNLELTTDEVLDMFYPNWNLFTLDSQEYKSRAEYITPQLAKFLMTRNISNRPICKNNIKYLKQQALSGNWKFSGEPIQIDTEGNLINGQHRLTVIIELEKALPLLILSGFKNEIFSVLDTGKKRQGADVLAILGVKNSAMVSAAIRIVNTVEDNSYNSVAGLSYRNFSNQDVLNFYLKHQEIEKSGEVGMAYYKHCKKMLSPSLCGAFHFLLTKIDETMANEFLSQVCTGIGLRVDSPTTALRNRLLTSSTTVKQRLTQVEIIKLIISAWNKYRNNEKCKSLKTPNEIVELSR